MATSSVAGIMPSNGSYGVGKHGCLAIMESLHEELKGKKATHVTTHVLCPGVANIGSPAGLRGPVSPRGPGIPIRALPVGGLHKVW